VGDATFTLKCEGKCWGTGHAFKLVKGKCARATDLGAILDGLVEDAEKMAKQKADEDCAYRADKHKECVCRGIIKHRDVGTKKYKHEEV
jgi:hypothetical protein